MVRTRVGHLWIGTRRGLVRFREEGADVFNTTNTPALGENEVSRLIEDASGGLWIGTPNSVVRWSAGHFERIEPGLPPNSMPNVFLPDTRSGHWVGTSRALAQFFLSRWTVFDARHGMRDIDVNSLAEDPKGGIWVGTHQGIQRLNPRTGAFDPIDLPIPYARPHIQAIWVPTSDTAWVLSSTRGESGCRLWRREAGAWRDVTTENNQVGGRLLLASFAQPGAFWNISSSWGLNRWIDPSSQELLTQPPSLRENIWSLHDDGQGNLWVGTSSSGIELWRMEGATATSPFAALSHLNRPQARNPLVGAGYEIGLGVLVLSLSLWALSYHQRRVYRLRQETQRKLSEQRECIARDLHDQLGSQVTRLTLLASRAESMTETASSSGMARSDLLLSAQELSRSFREVLWHAQPADPTLYGLLNHLGDQAQLFLNAAGVRCRLRFADGLPGIVVNSEARQDVFLAAKEALHNVVRHADASEVHVVASIESGQLEIRIEDDGAGFRHGETRADSTGYGLTGIHRRLRNLGGTCAISSCSGRGTRILLAFPLARLTQS